MTTTVLYTIISLSVLGAIAAIILYVVAQKFKVYEDPRIDQVEDALPGANCGGCGYPGCRGFAEAIVKSDDLKQFNCPVGGNDTMQAIAKILGQEIEEQEPLVAVVRCNGSHQNRPQTSQYDGPATCAIESTLYGGETGCHYGCLGKGDCVEACDFEAIFMNQETGLPYVVDDNCTACGACVTACPNDIIELRKKNKKDRKIYVSCVNQDKGALARKVCQVACIGCGKCVKVCPFDAITMENNLAFIHSDKCKLCRKCVEECPTNAILEIGFPPRKKKKEDTAKESVKSENKENN
jgi:Na+-translocating ferredoxin:NAD+ oxidoreductase RNF subunit RnfB